MYIKIANVALIFVLAASAFGQQPKVENAKLETVSAASGLGQTIAALVEKRSGPAWIGYSIPVTPKERTMCCFESVEQWKAAGNCCGGCRLEKRGGTIITGSINSECGPLEPSKSAFVMLRAEDHKITKVRTFTPDCLLDVANLTLYWLTQVNPVQSVEVLAQIIDASTRDERLSRKEDIGRQALHAVALHDIPEADVALKKFLASSQPEHLREHTALLLGIERGKAGLDILRAAVRQDQNESFRRKALIGLAQSEQPEAIPELIYLARNDSSSQVRSQALFWLAQKGGRKEAQEITEAIENDPETEVKKKAVFALAQMPKDEGVPLLINVARTNRNRVVRKEAIRWLGFSNDSRALDFLEQILTK